MEERPSHSSLDLNWRWIWKWTAIGFVLLIIAANLGAAYIDMKLHPEYYGGHYEKATTRNP